MSTLFTLSAAWHDCVWLHEQLAFAQSGDAILLIQDGVLAVHSRTTLASFLAKCQVMNINVHVLQDDCLLRGVDNKYTAINAVDYAGFVALVSEHEMQVSW